jgi:hypothetical protein
MHCCILHAIVSSENSSSKDKEGSHGVYCFTSQHNNSIFKTKSPFLSKPCSVTASGTQAYLVIIIVFTIQLYTDVSTYKITHAVHGKLFPRHHH